MERALLAPPAGGDRLNELTKVDAGALVESPMISGQDRQRARAALEDCSGSRVVHVPQVLSAEHCAMLRAFIDERVTGDALDMIDRWGLEGQ